MRCMATTNKKDGVLFGASLEYLSYLNLASTEKVAF